MVNPLRRVFLCLKIFCSGEVYLYPPPPKLPSTVRKNLTRIDQAGRRVNTVHTSVQLGILSDGGGAMQAPEQHITKIRVSERLPLSLRRTQRLSFRGEVAELDLWWTTRSFWRRYEGAGDGWMAWSIGLFVVAYRLR